MSFPSFDPAQHVLVNKQNRPTTVFNPERRPVTVQPWSHVGPGGVVRNPSGIYLLVGESARHYADFVSPQGPLYVMPRREAEATLGVYFQRLATLGTPAEGAVGTPVGESVLSSQAKTQVAASSPTPPSAPAQVDEAVDVDINEDEEVDVEVELLTLAVLQGMSMPDLRAYASHWELKGSSRMALIDKLVAEGCVAAE